MMYSITFKPLIPLRCSAYARALAAAMSAALIIAALCMATQAMAQTAPPNKLPTPQRPVAPTPSVAPAATPPVTVIPSLIDYMCGSDTAQRLGAATAIVAKPSPYSSKLVIFPYNKDAIYPVNVFFNRYTHFEFATDEKLVGLYISDETEFERFVSVTGRDAMVRPRVRGVSGAATIITDKRRYQIELRDVSVCPQENQYQRVSWLVDQGVFEDLNAMPFVGGASSDRVDKVDKGDKGDKSEKRLAVADKVTDAVPALLGTINLAKLNTDYVIEGSSDIRPVMVMDDGERTYLKFADSMTLRPAMFAVSQDGDPQIVEYAAHGSYFVSAQLFSHGILLKHDKSEVRILSRRSKCGFWDSKCSKVDPKNIIGQGS